MCARQPQKCDCCRVLCAHACLCVRVCESVCDRKIKFCVCGTIDIGLCVCLCVCMWVLYKVCVKLSEPRAVFLFWMIAVSHKNTLQLKIKYSIFVNTSCELLCWRVIIGADILCYWRHKPYSTSYTPPIHPHTNFYTLNLSLWHEHNKYQRMEIFLPITKTTSTLGGKHNPPQSRLNRTLQGPPACAANVQPPTATPSV